MIHRQSSRAGQSSGCCCSGLLFGAADGMSLVLVGAGSNAPCAARQTTSHKSNNMSTAHARPETFVLSSPNNILVLHKPSAHCPPKASRRF
jgi:hypothetical protein